MHVIVVGGGISGLAAAWQLVTTSTDPALRVTVLEGSPEVGGKLRAGSVAGVRLDVGAESMLARRPEALELARQVGLGGQVVHPETSQASIRSRGALHPMPPRTLLGVPSDPEALRGLLTDAEVERVLAEEPSRVEVDDVAVGELVAGRLGDAVVDRLVEPLLGGVYAGHARALSAAAVAPALLAAAQRGESLVQAAAQAMPPVAGGAAPTAARSAAPRPTVAGGSAPAAPAPVFAGLAGGIHQLPARLTERLADHGVRVLTGTTVRELHRTPEGGWRLVSGAVPDPTEHRADAVVLALPPAPAARLLRDVAPAASASLAAVETASMAIVTLALPAGSPALPGSGVLVPPVERLAIKAATFSASKWAWVADAGDAQGVVVLRASLGRHGEERVLQRDDADLVAQVLADLASVVGVALPQPVDSLVQRWGGALPQYAVGHLDRVAGIRAAVAEVPGLAVCGAAYDGVGIPACIASGRAAADLVSAPAR